MLKSKAITLMLRNPLKILVIDENKTVADSLLAKAKQLKVELQHVTSSAQGKEACSSGDVDVVLLSDFVAGEATCFSLQEYRNGPSAPEIIIYSETGNTEHAEHSLESGAWDYVFAPSLVDKMPDILSRIVRYCRSKSQNAMEQQREVREQLLDHGIVGSSAIIKNCLDMVARISQSDASVLITGETGTGKELFASAIHDISSRCSRSLTIIDCAALPSTLVESILFGHAKGSFTGADSSKKGLVKQADGGTLFLDEIGEMPLEIQKKFLRVLQEQEYLPVGSTTAVKSDFRLISATNKDLEAMVEAGDFREDLLFRLKTFELVLPPLRTRKTDVAELAYFYRDRYCKKKKLKKKELSTDFLSTIKQYEWPGNVRELFQAVVFAIESAHESTVLDATHLPVNIRLSVTKQKMENAGEDTVDEAPTNLPDGLSAMPTIKEDREHAIQIQEKRYLQRLLALTNGEIKQCCKTAGLSRSRLYDLLKKHNLSQKNSTLHSPEKE